jgi:hypothetical protein
LYEFDDVSVFAKFATFGRFNCEDVGNGIIPGTAKTLVGCPAVTFPGALQIFLQLAKRISIQLSPTAIAFWTVLLRCTCRFTVFVYSAAMATTTIRVARTESTTTKELPVKLRSWIVFIDR